MLLNIAGLMRGALVYVPMYSQPCVHSHCEHLKRQKKGQKATFGMNRGLNSRRHTNYVTQYCWSYERSTGVPTNSQPLASTATVNTQNNQKKVRLPLSASNAGSIAGATPTVLLNIAGLMRGALVCQCTANSSHAQPL